MAVYVTSKANVSKVRTIIGNDGIYRICDVDKAVSKLLSRTNFILKRILQFEIFLPNGYRMITMCDCKPQNNCIRCVPNFIIDNFHALLW